MSATASAADLLFEIGTEELPPKALSTLSGELARGIAAGLREHNIDVAAEPQPFASPRRLAVVIPGVAMHQPDAVVERRGPPLNRAFEADGSPTRAALGFAQTCGVAVEALERLETDRGAWLAHRHHQAGRPTRELLPGIVQRALEGLPIPKRMRWNAMRVEFVRPVHWAVLMLGDEVVPAELLGVTAGRHTRGHRFHHPQPLELPGPADYAVLLDREGRVIAAFDRRRAMIAEQVTAAAAEAGGRAVIDEALLDEVTGLVEWPVAVAGSFDRRFLEVPKEAVVSALQVHQKSFPVVDGDGRLMPWFIAVANIASRDPASVRAGFQRVIRPRLSDADFFWRQDGAEPLAARRPRLGDVVFQQGLGTLLDKSDRVASLARHLAGPCGADAAAAERAAQLCKCDLLTRMVEEFPELQGTMGGYYARHDGEPAAVADAIAQHYQPRFAGDELPASEAGRALALADKLDTLAGVFAIGQIPTGDKDPFALRRAALGVIRILVEQAVDTDMDGAIALALQGYAQQRAALAASDTAAQIKEFILGRLRVYYTSQGFGHDEVAAVLAAGSASLPDVDKRLRALAVFRRLPEAESLTTANKRISNILRQAGETAPAAPQADGYIEDEERALAQRVAALADEVAPLLEGRDYEAALKRLAALREPVDAFFDRVMVMVDDERVRRNRLALLHSMTVLFARVADLSVLQ